MFEDITDYKKSIIVDTWYLGSVYRQYIEEKVIDMSTPSQSQNKSENKS
jgi:hypothetical protein